MRLGRALGSICLRVRPGLIWAGRAINHGEEPAWGKASRSARGTCRLCARGVGRVALREGLAEPGSCRQDDHRVRLRRPRVPPGHGGDVAILYSRAFKGAANRKFAGIPAVSASLRKSRMGAFSMRLRLSRTVKPGTYLVRGRCGGGNFGAAKLTVSARVSPPSGQSFYQSPAWTVISRHGEYAQDETECNVPQAVTFAKGIFGYQHRAPRLQMQRLQSGRQRQASALGLAVRHRGRPVEDLQLHLRHALVPRQVPPARHRHLAGGVAARQQLPGHQPHDSGCRLQHLPGV